MRRWIQTALLALPLAASAGFDGDPLYESRPATNGATFLAVRPFYSASVEGERWRKDYLWPIYTSKGFQDEQYGRFLFFGWSQDFSADDDRHRNWLIPLWFSGTSAEGEDYAALFPLGGTIHEFLGRDKVTFVLFPLYATSEINDVKSTSVLWPIYSRTRGEGIERVRVWPLYGTGSLEGEFEKTFVLWPIYTSVRYTNERNPGGGFIIVPVYGHISTEQAENWWFVAPLFRYMTSDVQWIVHAPWPFIQLADGEMYKRIFWPVYGKKHLGTLTRQYVLWPIVWNNKTEYARHDQHRRFIVPVFAYESDVASKTVGSQTEGEVLSRYWKIWPLMSWERNGDESRFRTVELWPLRNTPGIERNWAPWWTLYRRERLGERTAHHLLWGLYRQERSSGHFEWSLLKGIAGYTRNGESRQFRLLSMRFGGEEEP